MFGLQIVCWLLNSPNSDQHQISLCNIDAFSTAEVVRINPLTPNTKEEKSPYFSYTSTGNKLFSFILMTSRAE